MHDATAEWQARLLIRNMEKIDIQDAINDFPEVGEADLYHDCAQNKMYEIQDPAVLSEFSRITGVAIPEGLL